MLYLTPQKSFHKYFGYPYCVSNGTEIETKEPTFFKRKRKNNITKNKDTNSQKYINGKIPCPVRDNISVATKD